MSFGRITKLNVNIDKCQTRITYDDNSTRFLISNPSGFAFRSMGSFGIRCCTECASQSINFLQRHFGPGGSIPKTISLCNRLAAIGLDEYAQPDPEQPAVDVPQQQLLPRLYTWHVQLLPTVFPQYASKIVQPKGRLQARKLVWHLETCKWMHVQAKEYELPKCNCVKIKETMDNINEAMRGDSAGAENRVASDKRGQPNMNVNIHGINVLIRQLNELLEEQNRAKDDI